MDEFLSANHGPGITAEKLYEVYVMFGEDPFIMGPGPGAEFSAWDYAKQRCAEICEGTV